MFQRHFGVSSLSNGQCLVSPSLYLSSKFHFLIPEKPQSFAEFPLLLHGNYPRYSAVDKYSPVTRISLIQYSYET